MNINDLQAVLRERADSAGDGDPDIEVLLAKGQALRRRRQRVMAGTAAAVVAAIVAIPVFVAGGSNSGGGPATIVPVTSSPIPAPTPSTDSPTPTPSMTAARPSASATLAPPVVTTLGPPLPSSAPASASASPVDTSILVYGDCRTPTFEPAEIVLTCADHGLFFQDLQWTSWTSTRATAIGTEVYNDCTPNCAEGHFRSIANAALTLTTPLLPPTGGQQLWSKAYFRPQQPGYATGPLHGGPFPLPVSPS